MSTMASINLLLEDGSYKTILIERDGEPLQVGKAILTEFKNEKDVQELFSSIDTIAGDIELNKLDDVLIEDDTKTEEFNYLWKFNKWFIQSEIYNDKEYFPFTHNVWQYEDRYVEHYDDYEDFEERERIQV